MFLLARQTITFCPKHCSLPYVCQFITAPAQCLAEPTKKDRRAKLDAEPESVRGLIEKEALRLYKLRRKCLQ
jgi:hypothetical protein